MSTVDFTLEDLKRVFATKEDLTGFSTKEDLSGFATKEDLSGFATKEDLSGFATKEDLVAFASKEDLVATRGDLKSLKSDMLSRFASIETILQRFEVVLQRLDKRSNEDTVANINSIERINRRSLKTARQFSAHVVDSEAHGGKDGRSH